MANIRRDSSNITETRNYDSITLSNSSTETTFFTETVPAQGFPDYSETSVRSTFRLTTPVLLSPSLTLRVKYGTSVISTTSQALLGSLSNQDIELEVTIISINDTKNAQVVKLRLIAPNALSLGTVLLISDTTWTIDASSTQTLSVTAQFSSAVSGSSISHVESRRRTI